MADALIETTTENPYASIVSDTETQISNLDAKIQEVLSAIAKLEQINPTSQYLPQLKNRLSDLQQKMWNLNRQNESAKSLLNSYNDSLSNANTMAWIYQLKQAELNRAQQEADESYKRMYDDVKRWWQNYIDALWNATASENAIINANAWRYWASAQSTAEARARNYLANAQAQAEYNNNVISQLNAIEENRLNSNAWYVQLSQSNADNTLRQQVMNNFEASQNATKYWSSWWWSSKWKNVTLPDTWDWKWTSKWTTEWTKNNWDDLQWSEAEYQAEKMNDQYWTVWTFSGPLLMYHDKINWTLTPTRNYTTTWTILRDATDMNSALNGNQNLTVNPNEEDPLKRTYAAADLNRKKTNKFLEETEWWDLWSTFWQISDKWYVRFSDWLWHEKIGKISDLQ